MKKIRDMKALARETLIGRYGTVIGAYFLSGLMIFLSGLLALFCLLTAFANTDRFEPMIRKTIPSFQRNPALSVICAVLFAVSAVFTFILSCWLRFGRQKLLLNICRGEKYGCSDIFYAFKRGSHPWKVIGVSLLTLIFVEAANLIPAALSLAAGAFGYDRGNQDPVSPWGIAIFAANILALLLSLWLSMGFTFAETVIIDRPEAGVFEAIRNSLRITKHRKLKLFWMVILSFFFWYLLICIVKIASLWVLPYVEASVIIFYLCARGEEFVIPANRPETGSVPETEEVPVEKTEVPKEAPAEENVPEEASVFEGLDALEKEAAVWENEDPGIRVPAIPFKEDTMKGEETIVIDEEPVSEETEEVSEPVTVREPVPENVPEEIPEINGEEIIIMEDEV